MKFETPKIVINAFSENIVTGASDNIANSDTVEAAKNILEQEHGINKTNRILTFTFD